MTEKEIAMLYAKEIVIAKLSQSAPNQTNKDIGENVGEFYEAVYKKLYEIASRKEK